MNNIVIDLHSHSTISDGILSPTELVNHAHTKKVKVLALTDHDDIAGLVEAKKRGATTKYDFCEWCRDICNMEEKNHSYCWPSF